MAFLRRIVRLALPRRVSLAALLVAGCVAGCTPIWQTIPAGESRADVQARLGTPREVYRLPGGVTRWLYPTRPYGQHTIAVDFDAHGRVLHVQDVMTSRAFDQAQIGKWTEDDVRRHFGIPVETAYFPLMKREVWTYRFKQYGAWDMLMHFYFSPDGILRMTQTTPDPLHDPDRRLLF